MSRKGIPTEYGGVRFRSRLEATWAAFFDLLQWPWEYEPFDLKGYIPDFVLKFARSWDHQGIVSPRPDVVVDVKPFPEFGIMNPGLHDGAERSKRLFGHLDRYKEVAHGVGFGAAKYMVCGRIGHDSYDNCVWCGVRAWDFSKGIDEVVYNVASLDVGLLRAAWATAKNRVQWRGEFGA